MDTLRPRPCALLGALVILLSGSSCSLFETEVPVRDLGFEVGAEVASGRR